MRKNSREDWNKPIQELIRMMNEDYPNGYELVITTAGAEIRSTLDVTKKSERICERCKFFKYTRHCDVCIVNGVDVSFIPPDILSECDKFEERKE